MLIWLKSSSIVLVLIGSMPMPICNCFHERLANNGKITTFTRFCFLMPSCAGYLELRRSRLGPSKSMFNEIYVQCWKFHTQLVHVYLNWFQRNSLLKCVSQLKIAKKSIKTPILAFKVFKIIEFGGSREPVYDFLLVINSYLCPILHHYWDTATCWLQIANFFHPPSHLAPSFEVTPFEFMGKLYSCWNLNLSGSQWWRFGDRS